MSTLSRERVTGFIVGLGLVGTLLTSWLVVSELFREPTCPSLLGLPACYLVMAAYVAATAGAWRVSAVSNATFLTGAGLVTLIGIYFSVGQLRGVAECPTFEGLPMCYVSLFAGVSMLGAYRVRAGLAHP